MIAPEIKKQYDDIDWSELLRKDLGKHSLEEAKPQLDRIRSIFDDILKYLDSENLSVNYTHLVQNHQKRMVLKTLPHRTTKKNNKNKYFTKC